LIAPTGTERELRNRGHPTAQILANATQLSKVNCSDVTEPELQSAKYARLTVIQRHP